MKKEYDHEKIDPPTLKLRTGREKMAEYNHSKIERKWQKEWAKKKIYQTKNPSSHKIAEGRGKFYVLDMFPYVSGEGIHVGHPKGYIATDVVSRKKRMEGFNVLHPMGFDSFGLPTENYAIKTKTNPVVSVAKNIARFKKQLEIIGFDYDWSREVNTSDPKFYKWTQWIFLKLLERGLAYESNEPVNWCPKDKTILANEDVEDGKCERCGTIVEKKPIRQWVLKITDYADRLLFDLDGLDWPESIKESQKNWIGRSEGAEIKFVADKHDITVFTTRSDTIFGVTFIAVSPELAKTWLDIGWEASDEVKKYITKIIKDRVKGGFQEKEKAGIFAGFDAINPANKEKIPVWIVNYVMSDVGTGAIMGVPAHDERDFEFAKKYKLEIKEVVIPKVIDIKNPPQKGKKEVPRMAVQAIIIDSKTGKILSLRWKKFNWTTFVVGGVEENEDLIQAAKREVLEEIGYKNLKYIRTLGGPVESHFFAAHKDENRKAIFSALVFELEDEQQSEVSREEKDKHKPVWTTWEEMARDKNLACSEFTIWYDRFLKKESAFNASGILINSGKFDGMDSEKAKKEIIKFVDGKEKVNYKLHDWVFSRQRYWGEPIPVLRDGDKVIPVEEKDLPVKLPKVKSYKPTGTAESPLANVPNWINVKVGKKVLRRESNTMPQWAGSSWYFLRYMDPKNNKALVDKKIEKYWNEVDLYVGGAEHATRHLIYARFWHKFLYDIGVVINKEPFKKLQHVGLIIASDGRKMSKRFGNIINPDSIVSTYGADTLRIYEMFMGPFDQSVSWSDEAIIGPRRFLERVWRMGKKVSAQKNLPALAGSGSGHGSNFSVSSPLIKLLHKTIKKVSEDIDNMRFNTAVSSLMMLMNEMEKNSVSVENFKRFLQLLAPFAPHITEELWSMLGEKKSIHLSLWPEYDNEKIKDDEVKIVVQINGKVRAEIFARADSKEEDIKNKALRDALVLKRIEGKNIKRIVYVKGRLVNIVI